MIRIVKASGRYYGTRVDITTDSEQENIDIFVREGSPVILVNDLEDLEELDIDPKEVEMI